jgi:putative tricarboxylic transport membrane protein
VRPIEKWDRITGYILLIIGVVTAWSSMQLAMGSFKRPGPGFLPFGLACILIVLAVALIASRWKKGSGRIPFWPERTWLRPLLGSLAFALYALLIGLIGFLLTTFVFMILWMWVIEGISWRQIATVSTGVTLVLYLIFSYFLEVPLPGGIFS